MTNANKMIVSKRIFEILNDGAWGLPNFNLTNLIERYHCDIGDKKYCMVDILDEYINMGSLNFEFEEVECIKDCQDCKNCDRIKDWLNETF